MKIDRAQFGLKQVLAQIPEDQRDLILAEAIVKLHVKMHTKQVLPKY